jgi:hypothetical protein
MTTPLSPRPGKVPPIWWWKVPLFSGRTDDAERRLYAGLARELSPLGIPASDIKTILVEAPASDWGLHGKAASDIDLGYKIDV